MLNNMDEEERKNRTQIHINKIPNTDYNPSTDIHLCVHL